ncbi:MAG: D-Ala-D-Ala carboxypeptidase family metallohydrolase, partial [Cytophagales bacterium]|nr:D-Ala-D-Ala carboxypeptidase family metallohydrolase [Cytophagales bacterium]
FEPLRARFNRPIGISSFFRSAELNKKIGGSSRSQHCSPDGQAAMDIDADIFGGIENREIFEFIRDELPFDQLIWEFGDGSNPDWVHVSLKSTDNRKQILKAVKHGSKTLYLRY